MQNYVYVTILSSNSKISEEIEKAALEILKKYDAICNVTINNTDTNDSLQRV